MKAVHSTDSSCYHCALPIPAGQPFNCQLNGQLRQFCCPACMAVASTIVGAGLGSFYQFQTKQSERVDGELLSDDFSAFDNEQFQASHITLSQHNNTTIASARLLIGGIHCAACIWLLEHQLEKLTGIKKVSVNFSEQKASISWDPTKLSFSQICRAIAQIGYSPEPYRQEQLLDLQKRESRQALQRLGVAGIGMMQVGMFAIALYAGEMQSITTEYRDLMRWTSWLVATVVLLFSSRVFFIGAWRGLKQRKPGMDLPVALAIGLAYLASCKATILGSGEVYFDSVAMFTFLLLGGRYLEMRARHYSGRLSSDLHSLLPSTALLIDDSDGDRQPQRSIPLANLRPGDRILVKPGQVIPADGIINRGNSSINEAQLTGEFEPQSKTTGDHVVAGTINVSAPLIIDVEHTGAQLQIETINDLLSQAHQHKPQMAVLADRLSSYFISIVLLATALTFIVWQQIDPDRAFWVMLSVLVVSCPCALSLATPTALTAATNRLRRAGLLIADGQVWEKIPTLTHVVCDKTGTLTKGKLSLQRCQPLGQHSMQDCQLWAGMLESGSEHPIARAFQDLANQMADAIDIHVGSGVSGTIDGQHYRIGTAAFACELSGQSPPKQPAGQGLWILLADSQGPCGWFQLQDELREDAQSTVQALQQQGLKVHMLSGDSSGSAEQLSQQLGIDHCTAGASPKQKLQTIADLQAQGATVMMIGDGINDIPVLAAADVSIAMANASDLAKTHAGGILMSGHLSNVVELIALATRTRRTIRQNLSWSLAYNFSVIPLAAQGLIPPYLAAIGMSLSSLLVLLNALRLQRWQMKTSAHLPSTHQQASTTHG